MKFGGFLNSTALHRRTIDVALSVGLVLLIIGFLDHLHAQDAKARYMPADAQLVAKGAHQQAPQSIPTKKRLQVIKAGGIPKEGLGSTLGFITAAANIAELLDADLIVTQTAEMMGYRVSDIVNEGVEVRGGGRTCDIMEVLLDDPSSGPFQGRMDRAQGLLDKLYDKALMKCRGESNEVLLSDYALKELARCDQVVINDYRIVSKGWSPCAMEWWKRIIEQKTGPAHGNDIAIHFRWGDMFMKSQSEDKWAFNMTLVARAVDIIREENPSVVVNVFLKKSRNNESERQMREMLLPLSGDYNIIEAPSDVEELAMMAKARYLVINSGSYSTAAAAAGNADVVIFNGGGAIHTLRAQRHKHLYDYNEYKEDDLRSSVRATLNP